MHGETRVIEGLWWQVAVGVFIALCGHSLMTYLGARYEMHRALQQLEREAATMPAPHYPTTTPQTRPAEPLEADERCIRGERFKRLENGWQQVPSKPC